MRIGKKRAYWWSRIKIKVRSGRVRIDKKERKNESLGKRRGTRSVFPPFFYRGLFCYFSLIEKVEEVLFIAHFFADFLS